MVNLSAQLAANTDPKIQTLWTNTRVRPALRYALAHGAISGLDDIRNATAAQITPAIHYLDAQQKLHAEALNRLNSKAPDRRALAEQQLTSAGVARAYWSSDPNPNQAELDKHHIATASEESWDRFRANIATPNYWRRKPNKGLIHHSDRGSQYTSREYGQHLSVRGMQASHSRKGQCWDNALTERFFRSLKYEYLHYEVLKGHRDAKLSVLDYLAYYNSKRPHSVLGYLSPIEFERIPLIKVS